MIFGLFSTPEPKYCSMLLLKEINDVFFFEKHYVPFRLTTTYNNLIKTSHDTSIYYHDTWYINTVWLCIDTDLKQYDTQYIVASLDMKGLLTLLLSNMRSLLMYNSCKIRLWKFFYKKCVCTYLPIYLCTYVCLSIHTDKSSLM